MALSISQISKSTGVSRDRINKWMERGVLQTPIADTPNGVERQFTRANALEIAFTAAQTLHGRDPHMAAMEARFWIAREATGDLPRFWNHNPRRDRFPTSTTEYNPDLKFADRAGHLGEIGEDPEAPNKPAFSLTIIDRHAIVECIDGLLQA